MTRLAFRTALACVLLSAGSAGATNGMRMIGFGPVQNSMGGVSVGVPLDAATILTNPAGMADLPARVDFGASYFSPQVSYRAAEIPMPTGYQGAIVERSGVSFGSDRGASPVPAFGLVLPLGERARIGIGAYGVAGMGVDYAQNLYGGTTTSGYSQMRFAPALSYRFSDAFSVGISANVMFAQMDFVAAQGFGQVAHVGASAFGAGATVGLMFKPHRLFTIGVAYETPSTFQAFRFNTPRHTMPTGTTMPAGTDELTFNQPGTGTIGFGLRPVSGLTLGLDVQWINWSSTNGYQQPGWTGASPGTGMASPNGTLGWNLRWQDQMVVKVGAQYEMNRYLTVRAGYNWGRAPLNTERAFENIAFPAIAEHHVTAGLGLQLGDRFLLNVGAMYAPEASFAGANAGNPLAGQGQGIASYETKMSQFSVELGVGYRF